MLKSTLEFTCPDSGVTFTLRPIPPLNFDDFDNAYDEFHPPPTPPMREVKVVDKIILQPDSQDEHYKKRFASWSSRKEAAARHFLFARGVENDPPPDYAPDTSLYSGDLPPAKRKALWVSDQLRTIKDITSLVEAIQSINNVTEAGLEEAKKGIDQQPEVSISSNGQSSLVLIP